LTKSQREKKIEKKRSLVKI